MLKRPTSVTIVCWILIASGGIALTSSIWYLNDPTAKQITIELMSRSPIPVPLQHLMMYVGLLIEVISGIAMLRGRNWGRLLYVAWGLFNGIIGFATSPVRMGMIPWLVLFIVFAVILFRPKANQYFSAESSRSGFWPVSAFRAVTMPKVISVICYSLSGLFFYVACLLASINVLPIPAKCIVIGAAMFFGLFPLFFALWLTGFYKWQHYTGIILLSVAALSTFAMFSRAFVFPEIELHLPAEIRDPFTDYFAGIVCILVLGLAGVIFVMSGRKVRPNQRSDQSWFQDKDASSLCSTGNGWNSMENLQSQPKTQGHDPLSVKGVSILEFKLESSARRAGLHKGDVIIEYASERDVTIEKLPAVMAKAEPEAGQVRVVFVRDGQQYSRIVPSGPLGISAMNTTIKVPPPIKVSLLYDIYGRICVAQDNDMGSALGSR